MAGYVSSNKCGSIVECGCYIFELSRSINCQWQFFSCAAVAFSEQYHEIRYVAKLGRFT
jgi:hypothetical protein